MKHRLTDRLRRVVERRRSLLCVGIDPDPARIPSVLGPTTDAARAVAEFCREIILATADTAAAYKFNLAFFEALGARGLDTLQALVELVPADLVTIADAKRGDIGNSASFYARAFFERLRFDSVTLSPYMGKDSVLPFLEYEEKGIFLLVRTSNPGALDFQTLRVGDEPLYMAVAKRAFEWSRSAPGMLGFVVGATDLDALVRLREVGPDTPFLIPGVGAQGGSAREVVQAAGSGPVLVNSSRSVIYAGSGNDFAERAAQAAVRLRDELWSARQDTMNAAASEGPTDSPRQASRMRSDSGRPRDPDRTQGGT